MHQKWLTSFDTHTGKAILLRSYGEDFQDFHDAVKPVDRPESHRALPQAMR